MKQLKYPVVSVLTLNCVIIFLWLIYCTINLDSHSGAELLLPILLGVLQLVMLFVMLAEESIEAEDVAVKPIMLSLDPWEMQRELMRASAQTLPLHPVLNKGGVLYGLLVMEEVGETLSAIGSIMSRRSPSAANDELYLSFVGYGVNLQQSAQHLRKLIEAASIDIALTEQEAVELLDGTTDVAVVNCGLALACGLPGAAAYDEVVGSNLSKINLATGVIDKSPDGKWIKGIRFVKPDLRQVMIMSGCSFKVLPAEPDYFDPRLYPHDAI